MVAYVVVAGGMGFFFVTWTFVLQVPILFWLTSFPPYSVLLILGVGSSVLVGGCYGPRSCIVYL